jgi:CRISPR-associated exonuclease Cas4
MIHPSGGVDDEPVTLSALQHYSYCPRQYALMFREQIFQDNVYTVGGKLGHERADDAGVEQRDDEVVIRALPVWSDTHQLVGKCDVVVLRAGVPYPVEYKRGSLGQSVHDDVQVCAEALCLEEMFRVPVLVGAIYSISSRHRREVRMTAALRSRVLDIAERIRELRRTDELPTAVNDRRCTHCSIQDLCLPQLTDGGTHPEWLTLLERDGAMS